MNYTKDKVLKNCVRYKKTSRFLGPVTIYIPNEFFKVPDNPPDVITVDIKQFWKKS